MTDAERLRAELTAALLQQLATVEHLCKERDEARAEVKQLQESNKWLQSHIYALLCTSCSNSGCQRDGVTSHTCHWCGNDIHDVEGK